MYKHEVTNFLMVKPFTKCFCVVNAHNSCNALENLHAGHLDIAGSTFVINVCLSFVFKRSNVLPTRNSTYLKTCRYDRKYHPYCPIFQVGDVIQQTGYSFQDLATKASGQFRENVNTTMKKWKWKKFLPKTHSTNIIIWWFKYPNYFLGLS